MLNFFFFFNFFLVPLTALIISRDALLVAAGFYIRYISLTPPVSKTPALFSVMVSCVLFIIADFEPLF